MRLLLSTLFSVFAFLAFSQQENINITIENIDITKKGTIMLGLYSDQASFPVVGKEIARKIVQFNSSSAYVVIENVTPGNYSIAIFHDVNENKTLDKNFFGVPEEGYAFSKNVYGLFGPPSFSDAKFTVKEGEKNELSIKLEY